MGIVNRLPCKYLLLNHTGEIHSPYSSIREHSSEESAMQYSNQYWTRFYWYHTCIWPHPLTQGLSISPSVSGLAQRIHTWIPSHRILLLVQAVIQADWRGKQEKERETPQGTNFTNTLEILMLGLSDTRP